MALAEANMMGAGLMELHRLLVAVLQQVQDRRRRFLDRAAGDVDHRPVVAGGELAQEQKFLGDLLGSV